MNLAKKGKTLEDKKGCIRCLAWTHQRPVCPKKGRPCQEKVDGSYCNKSHDTALHDSGNKYCEAAHVQAEVNVAALHERRVLLAIEEVSAVTKEGLRASRGFWDNGATTYMSLHPLLGGPHGHQGNPDEYLPEGGAA